MILVVKINQAQKLNAEGSKDPSAFFFAIPVA